MAFGARTVSIAAFLCVTTMIAEPSPVQEQNRSLNSPQQWVARVIAEHIWNYQLTSEKNPECTRHYNIYREHLSNFTLWAVQSKTLGRREKNQTLQDNLPDIVLI